MSTNAKRALDSTNTDAVDTADTDAHPQVTNAVAKKAKTVPTADGDHDQPNHAKFTTPPGSDLVLTNDDTVATGTDESNSDGIGCSLPSSAAVCPNVMHSGR